MAAISTDWSGTASPLATFKPIPEGQDRVGGKPRQRSWGKKGLGVSQETARGGGLMGLARELEHSGLGGE